MKTCLICGEISGDPYALTCEKCGEGSWGPVIEPLNETVEPPAKTETQQPKKGKR